MLHCTKIADLAERVCRGDQAFVFRMEELRRQSAGGW
jgi:hypothetical protein